MDLDEYSTVSIFKSCNKISSSAKHRRDLRLVPATGRLKLVAMNVLGTLPKTTERIQHVSITKVGYSTLTRAVPIAQITTNTVAPIFLSAWVTSYGIPAYLLTVYCIQIVSRLFITLCTHLVTKHLTNNSVSPASHWPSKTIEQNHRRPATT